MPNTDFDSRWTDRGETIAQGGQMNAGDLYAIYDDIRLGRINPFYLPGENTVTGKASDRKKVIFSLAEKLWGFTPEGWLKAENSWLMEARKESGSNETGGKNKLGDVVSAEILIRIIAAAKLVFEAKDDGEISDEAVRALNLVLSDVCTKGRARMTMVDDKSVYSILKKGGLMIGTGGGKYLPYPEKALPELLLLLHRDYIRPEAYLE